MAFTRDLYSLWSRFRPLGIFCIVEKGLKLSSTKAQSTLSVFTSIKTSSMADIESQLKSVGASGALSAAAALQEDASKYTNTGDVEQFWALKTYKHAEVYMKLLHYIEPKNLKLTKFDDIIYRLFKRYFKTLLVDVIDMEDFKSEEAKKVWRCFCEQFKGKVENYNFGTLLRIDSSKDYTEENTLLVTRIQFYAVEIARNKRNMNKFHLKSKNNNDDDESTSTGENQEKITEKINNMTTVDESER